MASKKLLLECKDVSLGYERTSVIEHLDLNIYEGDYICVVGENGCGKSTLMKTILGLTKPVSGSVWTEESLKNGCIGYLPQQTQAQREFPATVYEVVMSGFLSQCRRRPFYRRSEKQQALENMKKMSILDLKSRCYGELSGGQQQRVLLARALCAASRLLVLDEPVTGLDPVAAQELYMTLKQLNEEGMSILMVTHDIQNAISEGNKILHFHDKQYFFGTMEAYKTSTFGKRFVGGEGIC